jgi:hypothetical protein
MGKSTKCRVRLHGASRETLSDEFPSVAAARRWVKSFWDRPYTIVKIKDETRDSNQAKAEVKVPD